MLWVHPKNLANFLPSILSASVILERYCQVGVNHLIMIIGPCDDCVPLTLKEHVRTIYVVILKKIYGIILFLNQFHLITFRCINNAKMASSKIMPSSIIIQIIQFGSKCFWWIPIKFNLCQSVVNTFDAINVIIQILICILHILVKHLIHQISRTPRIIMLGIHRLIWRMWVWVILISEIKLLITIVFKMFIVLIKVFTQVVLSVAMFLSIYEVHIFL